MTDVFGEIVQGKDGLIMPKVVADLTDAQRTDLTNGCGPQSMKVKLIPDSIDGVDFFSACEIHDCCYHFGANDVDKRIADRCFLYNLLVLVDAHCAAAGVVDRVRRVAVRSVAFSYYKAVADWGQAAFFAHKGGPNDPYDPAYPLKWKL
jgi:hypothetical protein